MLNFRNNRAARILACLVLVSGVLAISGCGRGGRKLHSTKGRVSLHGADVKLLSGSFVEFALVTDPTVRSSGIIQPDGTFKLETLENGSTRAGIAEGKYRVRIVVADGDPHKREAVENAVAARYLDFNSSGIVVEVPTSSDVSIACVPPIVVAEER